MNVVYALFLLFVVSSTISKNLPCETYKDCSECVQHTDCVFIKQKMEIYKCISKENLLSSQSLSVYRTEFRCGKLKTDQAAKGFLMNSEEKINDSLKIKQPEYPAQNKILTESKQDDPDNKTEIKTTSAVQDLHKDFKLNEEQKDKVYQEVLPRKKVQLTTVRGFEDTIEYTNLVNSIVNHACRLNSLFHEFGNLDFLNIHGIPNYRWVKFQISNPVLMNSSLCSFKF